MEKKKGGGILPLAFHKSKIKVLIGRETGDYNEDFADKYKWSDFGGGGHSGESYKICAAREGFEETCGAFGSQFDLIDLIDNKLVSKIKDNNYTMFVVHVPYDKSLEGSFKEIYNAVRERRADLIQEENGFFEKDMVKWVPLEMLKPKKNRLKLRPGFQRIIRHLCKELL